MEDGALSEAGRYPPIGDYALLADCHSAALVSRTGSVDWACLRRFDAASVFGRLLDWDRGGYFALTPDDLVDSRRRYLGDSLVLETTLRTRSGRARILDAFAMRPGGQLRPRYELLRVVEGLDGRVTLDVCIEPRFDYGELRPWLRRTAAGHTFTAVGGDSALVIACDRRLDVDERHIRIAGRVDVDAGQRVRFSVVAQEPHALDPAVAALEETDARLAQTMDWWARWSTSTAVGGPYAAAVRRSAAVLKGLTCAPTGGIVAAPTTSLPEEIGGERNWDYRYSWIRDSTLAVAALFVAGHAEVARGFRDFIMRSAAGTAEDLQIMYGPYGSRHLPEYELDLEGWRGSRPVRVGNRAARQVQHDMYGYLLDTIELWRQTQDEIDPEEWRFLRTIVDAAARVWEQPDRGLWEIRGAPRHFVHSKVMLWVALDRGIRIAEETGLGGVDLDRWRSVRAVIREAVDARGVDRRGGWFVQAFGTSEVDASLLQLPMVGYCAATDERMMRTVEAIERDLCVPPQGFVRRYRTERCLDGLRGDEATFLLCSFWLVDVLAMQGRRDDAVALFERLLSVASDLGLYAEEYDPTRGELLGNFPQAFTHMGLINSAHHLACAQARPG
ncbi:MAG: glycoside hydrolase family 15 protein, partial [Actinomycetota bacterium]|nr:glycoside hydrolase family 15 protein [Actinomycetota bacterium]